MLGYTHDQYCDLAQKFAQEQDGLNKQKALLEELKEFGLEAVKAAESARSELEDNQIGIGELEGQCRSADEAYNEAVRRIFTEAPANPALDHESEMDAMDRYQRRVSYFRRAVDFARCFVIPRLLLKTLESGAKVAVAQSDFANQAALVACIERFIASHELLNVEGTVEFNPGAGKTGQLIEHAKNAYRAACAATEAVTLERSRQVTAGIGIAFERARI